MKTIDLSILKEKPELTEKIVLEIESLAPLSMVSDLPGSFYKSLKSPSKKMLCGLFENMLGWHIDIADRILIEKDLIKLRKKQKIEYQKPQLGSTYIPLLMEYFDIELITIPPMILYNDYWNKASWRADADVHPRGTMNISSELIPIKRELVRDEKNPKQAANSEVFELFKNNIGKFPLYYSTPTTKEFIHSQQSYKIALSIDRKMLELTKEAIANNNILYLGNSEGWVNLNII